MTEKISELEQAFGKDRLASVYLNTDGQVGVMYGKNATITYRPEVAAKALELVSELMALVDDEVEVN